MAKVSGVPVELITNFGGVPKALVRKLGNKLTAELGFGPDSPPGPPGPPGPPAGPSCVTMYLGYSNGGRSLPSEACIAEAMPYDYDAASGILYMGGGCGIPAMKAISGYYSDGRVIYDFTSGTLQDFGLCGE